LDYLNHSRFEVAFALPRKSKETSGTESIWWYAGFSYLDNEYDLIDKKQRKIYLLVLHMSFGQVLGRGFWC
jgi:hypothetical protein